MSHTRPETLGESHKGPDVVMIPNAAEADATSAIGEFGKIFSGAGLI